MELEMASYVDWIRIERIYKGEYPEVSAMFIPMLATALLQLNGNAALVGNENRNSRWTTALLLATLFVSLIAGAFQLLRVSWGAPL